MDMEGCGPRVRCVDVSVVGVSVVNVQRCCSAHAANRVSCFENTHMTRAATLWWMPVLTDSEFLIESDWNCVCYCKVRSEVGTYDNIEFVQLAQRGS
jgi:hypothetical protein